MPTAVLAGAFGQRNPGDDALLSAFAAGLEGWDLTATAAFGAPESALAGCTPVRSDDPVAVARAVARADAVVFAGGTVFKTLGSACGRPPLSLLRRALALASGASALGRPLAMVGVGAGALPSAPAQSLARRLVNRADLLILRDDESAAVLTDAGARTPFRVGADPAWTLFLDAPLNGRGAVDAAARARRGVLVVLSHHAGGPRLAARLADALAPVLAAGVPLVLQPFQVGVPGADDLELGRAVRDRLGGVPELIVPPADLIEARDLAREFGAVVALRFHAAMAAAAAGTPFVAYAHEPKLAAIARRLRQPVVGGTATPEALGAAALNAIGGPPAGAPAIKAEVARAEEGFRLLALVLTRGRGRPADDVSGLPLAPEPWTVPEEVRA
ncbi:MAG TPA: polysaccharide pyruvyl transferase family protein [Baekduia sp.]|uniref:polysaccharide pyruvyl transferase family protein n=1 Tax=Baekduia sp. TaxID=2600305 RepID=UPI002D79D809|nr:polysaccharide pyruvyl transferase family protein [Baekduia sp.]HET6506874.1 polysaccharide pyruvyl transferase family protein [Baekduia sp.]